jgi:hypothetical protein
VIFFIVVYLLWEAFVGALPSSLRPKQRLIFEALIPLIRVSSIEPRTATTIPTTFMTKKLQSSSIL